MIDSEKCPRSYLGFALMATCVFLSPLGLLGIYHGAFVKKYWEYGDIDKAIEESRKARLWSWIAILVNIIIFIITLSWALK